MIKRDPWQRKLIKTDIGGEWKREENEKGKREPPHSKISVSKYTPTRRWRRKDGKRRKTRTLHMAATGLVHTRLYFVLFRPRRASWRRWRRKGDSIRHFREGDIPVAWEILTTITHVNPSRPTCLPYTLSWVRLRKTVLAPPSPTLSSCQISLILFHIYLHRIIYNSLATT